MARMEAKSECDSVRAREHTAKIAPLSGLRVIDLTHVVLGPLATMILGDLGADVIKVESLDGDILRKTGAARNRNMGAAYLNLNRNKRSISIDLKRTAGIQVVRRLLSQADIFVHSMRAKAVDRLGLSYDSVSITNPHLIYCAAVGFGAGGPYESSPAYDDIIQASAGLVGAEFEITGHMQFVSSLVADKTVGLTVVYAILAALLARERTGQGQAIEVPMFETMVQFTMFEHLNGLTFHPPVGSCGHPRMRGRPPPYPTRDGFVCVMPYTTAQWQALFAAFGRDDLSADDRFSDTNGRCQHMAFLHQMILESVSTLTTEECLSLLNSRDVPASRVNSLDQVLTDPQVVAVSLIDDIVHPSEGHIRSIRTPIRFSKSATSVRHHAPQIGEQTEDILRDAGYSDSEVAALLDASVVSQPPKH